MSRKRKSRDIGPPLDPNPFHILMNPDSVPLDESKLKLKGRLKRDYLSKRHRLLQLCKKVSDRQQQGSHEFWSGATAIEKSLLSCCELPHTKQDNDDYVVPGALSRSKIPTFLGLAAVDCYGLDARALALAILERTWEADEEAKEQIRAYNYSEEGAANNNNVVSSSSPARKAAKLHHHHDNNHTGGGGGGHIAKVGIQGKADRLLTFFAGGGLRILNQWLMDASTPVYAPEPKPPPSTDSSSTTRPKRTPSEQHWKAPATGDLLLPLLTLLTYSPFNLDLVTESKINKQIRKLSKEADAIVLEAQQNRLIKVDTHKDAKLGGLLVKTVQKALNDLKEVWKTKQKEESLSEEKAPTDPFAAIKEALRERLAQAKEYDHRERGGGGGGDKEIQKPAWLARAEEAAAKTKKNRKTALRHKKKASLEQLAKLERNKERQQLLHGDLQKASAERAQLMKKIRELNHKKQSEAQSTSSSSSPRSRKRRKVHWKDGLSTFSTTRKRDKLEQVFVLPKEEEELSSSSSAATTTAANNNDEDTDDFDEDLFM
mmetsp:Transcript_6579/g.18403  ORF Transcript_6579/g.18403 Transcript_6579/m.18403 type:complete len:544 (+) Transcript_6579:252-1883(+)